MYDPFSVSLLAIITSVIAFSPLYHPPIQSTIPSSLESSWKFAQSWADAGDNNSALKLYHQSLEFGSSLPPNQRACAEEVTRRLMKLGKKEDRSTYEQLWADCSKGNNSNYADAIASDP
jgi:hypothetical protein